jgi:hypothetical protein
MGIYPDSMSTTILAGGEFFGHQITKNQKAAAEETS